MLYFAAIHDKHHSLFHQPSVEADLENGTLPDVLLYAMMALAARFSDDKECLLGRRRRTRGNVFAIKAKELLDVTDISVTTIQACVLLGTICFSDSTTEAETLYYAIANRLAQILDLPNRPAADELQKQIHLRVYCSLYMIDIWSSIGLGIPRMLGCYHNVTLPAEETVFLGLRAGLSSQTISSSGIWAAMVQLAHIWAEIHDLNQAGVDGLKDPSSLNSEVAALSAKLNNWSVGLPSHLEESQENLERYARLGLGSALAALHLGFHFYNEVLFYQFLAINTHQPEISAEIYSNCCKTHAQKFCDLLYACNSIPNCEVVYVMLGHMLVVTSTVHIHTLVFSLSEEAIRMARYRLEQNFRILTKLQLYWTKLDVSLSRLKAFHDACRISTEQSFRMDKWMIGFILEHGMPVNEKFPDGIAVAHDSVADTSSNGSPVGNVQDWYRTVFQS